MIATWAKRAPLAFATQVRELSVKVSDGAGNRAKGTKEWFKKTGFAKFAAESLRAITYDFHNSDNLCAPLLEFLPKCQSLQTLVLSPYEMSSPYESIKDLPPSITELALLRCDMSFPEWSDIIFKIAQLPALTILKIGPFPSNSPTCPPLIPLFRSSYTC